MKVAIIGAGLSGLACAYTLKSNGIIPTVYDRKNHIGEVLDLPAVNLGVFDFTHKRPLDLIKDKYKISLTPHYPLKEIITVTANKTYQVKGDLGNILLRGREKGYITMQLEQVVNLPYVYNTMVDPAAIKDQYDHIVVGTGDIEFPLKMNLVRNIQFEAWVRIATVLGDFNVNSIKVWFNTGYAKHGFAYLVPVSNKDARLVLIVDNIKYNELDSYWDEFMSYEGIRYQITELKDVQHKVGHVYPVKYQNFYLTGNTGGFIDSMLGFGSLKSIMSGCVAAECILKGQDYNKKTDFMRKDLLKKYEFRKFFNTLDNEGIDRCIASEHLPVVKQLIFSNPLVRMTHGAFLVKVYNMIKRN